MLLLNFAKGPPSQFSEFVKDAERGREREGDGRRGRYGEHVLSVYYLWGPGYILVY